MRKALVPFFLLAAALPGFAQTDQSFSYQGRLSDAGVVANGAYGFSFKLTTAPTNGTVLGTVTQDNVLVSNGLFHTELDFGSNAFNGSLRWLEIGVRPSATLQNFVTLQPRQPITAAPQALYALTAGTATTLPWTALTQIPAGPGLILSNSTFGVATQGITHAMLANDAVETANLKDGAVTRNKIAAGQAVKSLNGATDDVTLTEGANVKLTRNGAAISVATFNLWKTTGNAGTTPGQFLGTLDNVGLEFRVNNLPALRIEPKPSAPNFVAGNSDNDVSPDGFGAAIGGGSLNTVDDPYGTIGGGTGNFTGNNDGNPFIGGYSTVGGGQGNFATGESSTIAGGGFLTAEGEFSTVGGGGYNAARGYASTIAGGGGYNSSLDISLPNLALGFWSAIGGGADNKITNEFGTIAGGGGNGSSGQYSTVGGGRGNGALADYATVPGGNQNKATEAGSFAAGTKATAGHLGAFVWADATDLRFLSVANNEFAARSTGGARFVTAVNGAGVPTAGVQVAAGGGSWSSLSDRDSKRDFQNVDGRELLEKLARIPIQTWSYKTQSPEVRHMGPVAQDFRAEFGLGEDEKHISNVDADGVSLAAIQSLYALVREKESRLAEKERQIQSLEDRLRRLEDRVEKMK
jgi:hypothetical protein